MATSSIDIVDRAKVWRDCMTYSNAAFCDEMILEIERLRAALRELIDAIDTSPSRLPPGAGPQEIGAQYRAMVYRVSGHHVEKAREALGE